MAALANSKQIYSDLQQVSATTNRLIDGNDPEPPLPAFYCTSCDVKLDLPMQAIHHFHSRAHILKKSGVSRYFWGLKRYFISYLANNKKEKYGTVQDCHFFNLLHL